MPLPKIQLPVFVVEVPSSKKKVRFRVFTAREEKILLRAKASGDPADVLAAVKQVCQNCAVDPWDADKATTFDVEWVFVQLRVESVSNIAPVSYRDPADSKTYDFDVDLRKVAVKWPEAKRDKIEVVDGLAITLRYPPAAAMSDARVLKGEEAEALDALVSMCLDKVFDGDEVIDPRTCSAAEVSEFLDSLDVKTYDAIREFLLDMPRLDYVIEYENSKGDQRRIVLATLTDFFTF